MAQCYAESKPIGATFDTHGGGGYTGRLYCSGYQSYPRYAPAPATRTSDLLVPMLLRPQKQPASSRASSDRTELPKKLEKAAGDSALTVFKAQTDESPKPPVARDAALVRKSSGEQPVNKLESVRQAEPARKSSGEQSARSTDSATEAENNKHHLNAGKSRSGEITEVVSESLRPHGCSTRPMNASNHQSWPSSPANFRPSPRTRNLSEGSFSMIFPEEGQSSRLYSTSPSRGRSKDTKEVASTKLQTVTNNNPQQSSKDMKRGEMKEDRGRPKSYTGSPPRTSTSKEAQFIRHSRNVSDGNWAAMNGLKGATRSNLSTPTSAKLQIPSVEKTTTRSSLKEGINGGFVTGGSFTRTTSAPVEKCTVEKAPEVATSMPSSFGNITRGGSMSGEKSYGNGNVYFMGESMLLKKALSSKDAEEVKNIGNDQYKKGHFNEALSLYDRAVSLSPGQAAYHSNRAAALAALGRLVEAVHDCQEALLLDPKYSRAHQRLGVLFLRLGWTQEARKHLQSVVPVDAGDIQRMEIIGRHLSKSHEARKLRDWRTVIRESDAAVVAGADSSIQAYALKAEALLKLGNVNEAEKVILSAKHLGAKFVKQKNVIDTRMLFIVQTEIDLAQGRFDEALNAAEKAIANEPSNAEVCAFEKKMRRIVRARAMGNDLFKAGKYFEALAAYGEGLELDPENPILFCNRAACRSKLRLWEKAIEDCNAALVVQPNYTKALLRRAQCYAQLERWESALRDYEVLKSKLPGDVEVARALFEVQVALKKSKGEEIYKFRFGGEIEEVYSPDQLKQAITSPGLAVVHFITRWSERCKQITPFIDLLCKRYPSVNFVKVDIEDHPFLAKTERVGTVPTFKMYKNGLKVTEMMGPSQQKLEDAVQHYIL